LLLSKKEYEDLQRAISIVNSAILQDTGEQIPRMMRMCAFVPVNVPILFGMLMTSPTTFNTIFWQWFNQSFNAGLNYGNRNASSNYTMNDLAKGYLAAVGGSVGVALTLRKLFSGITKSMSGTKLILLNSLVASFASASANFLNTFCMRSIEMKQGIDVYADPNLTEKIGTSKECAKKAVISTAVSRMFLSFSCLMTPAFFFYLFEKMKLAPTRSALKMPYETGIFIFCLMVSLPMSIAVFPQTGSMNIEKCENEI
jgi:hypothetical protein